MLYRNLSYIFFFLLVNNCVSNNLSVNKTNKTLKESFSNKGFTLVYSVDHFNKKIISNKLDERSLVIFQRNLKKNTQVKITNILNNKSLIAIVGRETTYPSFNNSVLSIRIADELDVNILEPYIEITEIKKNSLFIAKKAKTFDEEKEVANKVPVSSISIDNLNDNEKKNNKIKKVSFSYNIKVGDFYFKDTALMLVKRIKSETNIQKPNIKKLSDQKYRVYLGPFDNINSLQNSFNDILVLEFENIEIIKND